MPNDLLHHLVSILLILRLLLSCVSPRLPTAAAILLAVHLRIAIATSTMGDALSATDFKTSMDKILAEITSVRDEITTIKGEQSRLTVAVNRLQSDKHESGPSGENDDDKDADTQKPPPLPPPPPPTHKLRFPKYDGAEDSTGWLHKCEQFFRAPHDGG